MKILFLGDIVGRKSGGCDAIIKNLQIEIKKNKIDFVIVMEKMQQNKWCWYYRKNL